MKGDTISIRLSEDFIKFSKKLQANRVIAEVDSISIGNPETSRLIVKYFKINNDRYLELIKLNKNNYA